MTVVIGFDVSMADDDTSGAVARTPRTATRLVGVYHASGTIWGEVAYWLRARLGGAHCSLCDITHGSIREKPDWRSCRERLPVPFATVHLDERDDQLRDFTEGRTPCVVAVVGDELVMLVGDQELSACAGEPERLVEAIGAAAAEHGLALTSS